MKAKLTPQLFAMMAASAIGIGAAHAQGMPADAQQLVQTMRPMVISQATPEPTQTTAHADDEAYGGMLAGTSTSASGRRQGCTDTPRCDIFFGQ